MYRDGLWVFGYGSLIWNPGFEYAQKELAELRGFRRGFCMWSVHYRGTAEAPGLVLALDAAASESCHGVAYFIPAPSAQAAHEYLRARELVSAAYVEGIHEVALQSGKRVRALCYIVDPAHEQYAGGLSLEAQAQVIARATGSAGPNHEYLENTAAHLSELGIADSHLESLHQLVCEKR